MDEDMLRMILIHETFFYCLPFIYLFIYLFIHLFIIYLFIRHSVTFGLIYRKTSNIRRTLVGNKIIDHSDVVGASPVGAAPTTSSFST